MIPAMKLRFTTRELILVTIIVALAAGWWLDRTEQRERHVRHLQEARDTALQSWTKLYSQDSSSEVEARATYFRFRKLVMRAVE